jgi:hypothetical protein
MNQLVHRSFVSLVVPALVLGFCTTSRADDPTVADRLSLADLAAYRAALSGRVISDTATASDPPVQVKFNELWNRPDAFRGRRVSVHGRVERIFRQGPVGSFPALSEVWIVSPAGDPICFVAPQREPANLDSAKPPPSPREVASASVAEPGQMVRCIGIFLKMVKYAAGDGARFAPLVVGDQPPLSLNHASKPVDPHRSTRKSSDAYAQFPRYASNRWPSLHPDAVLVLIVALVASLGAVVLASRHLRAPTKRRQVERDGATIADPDLPLEFLKPRSEC